MLAERVQEAGVDFEPQCTRTPSENIELVCRLASATSASWCGRAGGDGTWLEAVDGAMRAARPPTLGLLPTWIGNDFAKMLGTWTAK